MHASVNVLTQIEVLGLKLCSLNNSNTHKFRPHGCCTSCIDVASLTTSLFGYRLSNTFLVQFSVTPLCNSRGFWWGYETDAKVLLKGCVSLTGTDSIYEHIVVLFDSPQSEQVQKPMDIRKEKLSKRDLCWRFWSALFCSGEQKCAAVACLTLNGDDLGFLQWD